MSREHYLEPNHNSEMPTRIICVDTESWTENPDHVQRLRLGTAIYMRYQEKFVGNKWTEETFRFETVKQFHLWLESIFAREKKVRIWIISHNMSYDFPILEMDNYLSGSGWSSPRLFVPANPFLYYTSRGEKNTRIDLRIISSTNWYNWPLKKLAKVFGSFKMELPGSEKEGFSFDSVPNEVLHPYCDQDTIALSCIVKGHIAYIHDNDLGTVQPTIAGQAFSAYRHRFMPRDIPLLVHHRPKLIGMELDSYKGGRTEVLQLNKIPDVYVLDVNSMYPAVMHHEFYPVTPKCKSPIQLNSDYIPESWSTDYLIAKCQFSLKEPAIGVHRKEDHKLIFPLGNIQATLTSPELHYIQDNPDIGEVHKIIEIAAYDQSDRLFTSYIDHFYPLKCNAKNPIDREEAKLMQNSLYGHFGMRLHPDIREAGKDEDVAIIFGMKENNIPVLYTGGKTYIRSGDRILVKDGMEKGAVAENSMPRLASAVTAYARLYLWNIITAVGLEKVYYCDTDSIITDEEGLHRCMNAGLCDETRLGALKWEGPFEGNFLSPKHYGMNGHWKNKGIKRSAKQIGDNSWEQTQFQTGMSRYRDGNMDGVKVVKLTKSVTDIVNKGTVTKSGRVIPLVLNDF